MRINEIKNNTGLYVALKLDKKSSKKLYNWFKNQDIEPISKEDFHVTLVYSKKYISYYPTLEEPIILNPTTFEIKKLGDALVLSFEDKTLRNKWEYTQKLGATWDYDGYIPHITIVYNTENIDPTKVQPPSFNIVLNKIYNEELKEE